MKDTFNGISACHACLKCVKLITRSMQLAARRYGGELFFSAGGGIFTLTIVIPLPDRGYSVRDCEMGKIIFTPFAG